MLLWSASRSSSCYSCSTPFSLSALLLLTSRVSGAGAAASFATLLTSEYAGVAAASVVGQTLG